MNETIEHNHDQRSVVFDEHSMKGGVVGLIFTIILAFCILSLTAYGLYKCLNRTQNIHNNAQNQMNELNILPPQNKEEYFIPVSLTNVPRDYPVPGKDGNFFPESRQVVKYLTLYFRHNPRVLLKL